LLVIPTKNINMKKSLQILALALILNLSASLSAQTTYNLDWGLNINGAAASLTIEPGDTVEWTWVDNLQHNVASTASAQESFNSGLIQGQGSTWSYTFTEVGVNDYECTPHSSSMFGTITVEEALSVDDKFARNLLFTLSQSTNRLRIQSLMQIDELVIYNLLGVPQMRVMVRDQYAEVDLSALVSGVYLVKATSQKAQTTFKVVKR
jgi:plastocyanin